MRNCQDELRSDLPSASNRIDRPAESEYQHGEYAKNPQDAVVQTITGYLYAKGEYGNFRNYAAPGPGYAPQG